MDDERGSIFVTRILGSRSRSRSRFRSRFACASASTVLRQAVQAADRLAGGGG